MKQYNIRLPENMIEGIQGMAKHERRTTSEICRAALEQYLSTGHVNGNDTDDSLKTLIDDKKLILHNIERNTYHGASRIHEYDIDANDNFTIKFV